MPAPRDASRHAGRTLALSSRRRRDHKNLWHQHDDGIAEDLITALSRFRWFLVVARNSSFIYKGRAVDVRTVGRELGVRYVLEGSVRKGGSRLRITAQLIDAVTGSHLWAEKY